MNRYIKAIHLKNFQSYKDQVIELQPGLNLIVGTSDSGKSALLRAISFVLYNYPKKETLIHWGQKETSVTLKFSDGVEVTRIKGENRNAIIAIDADGKKIEKEKIDTDIPEEIKALLGNPPKDEFNGLISYADQFSKLFLVDLTPSDLPRSLSNLTGVEILEESAKQLMQNYKSMEKQNRSDEKELSNLINDSQSYSYVNDYEIRLNELYSSVDELDICERHINSLEIIANSFDSNISDDCFDVLNVILSKVKIQKDELHKAVELCNKINQLELFMIFVSDCDESLILESLNKMNLQLKDIRSVLNQSHTAADDLSLLTNMFSNYEEIKRAGISLTTEHKNLQNEKLEALADLENFKQKLIDENVICDKCGGVIN